jgi:hypothetical protein
MSRPRPAPGLDRLLGPAGPEVSCEVCFDELDRYVELQLGGTDAERSVPGMAAHLRGCPACSEEHTGLTALLTSPEAGQLHSDPGSTP